ncbi:DUF892 family protein [Segetibacter sp.]|jgi:ferritin-like metal-binding protein YciE|uniref:YciE/YciF ferroxidase family protein n=1 Tax=Segetibacter sp. TaxID=2231182 RepID=UPI002605CF6E|nr:DUF892 family protein [Segetibacter sp.]MCW3082608.1 hypothetical protein [Segetibacter sp.]
MNGLHDLLDLLLHHLTGLYAAEQQIKKAFPTIIEKVNHSSLKNALKHHDSLSGQQLKRLLDIPALIKSKLPNASVSEIGSRVEVSSCKGITGLIDEANELLQKSLSTEVIDAAIIASVQKIEHYEICAYGTAVAYANQLNLHVVAALLNETLQEEYDADDLLTALATAAINKEGLPGGFETANATAVEVSDTELSEGANEVEHTTVSINERTINSPGGRAGTSHRRYGNGESRGH